MSTNIYEGSEKHKKVVQKMSRMIDNKECADCTGKGPSWASWNLGVFICIKCAGIHRKLGTHISQVRSSTLDKWALHQVQNMEKIGGNIKANEYYEYNKPEKIRKPHENDDHYSKEKYIRNKYEKKLWIRKDGEPLVKENGASNGSHSEAATTPSRQEQQSNGRTATSNSSSSNGNASSNGNPMRRAHLSAAVSRRTKSTSDEAPSLIDFGSDQNGNSHQKSLSAGGGLDQFISVGSKQAPVRQQQQQPVRNPAPQQQQQPVRNGVPQQQQWDQNLLIDEAQERNKHKTSIMGLFDQPQMPPQQPQQRRFLPPQMPPQHMGYPPRQGMPPMMHGRPMGYPPRQPMMHNSFSPEQQQPMTGRGFPQQQPMGGYPQQFRR